MSHVETFDFASNEYLVPRVLLADTLIAVPHLTPRSVGKPDCGASFVARLAHAHSEPARKRVIAAPADPVH